MSIGAQVGASAFFTTFGAMQKYAAMESLNEYGALRNKALYDNAAAVDDVITQNLLAQKDAAVNEQLFIEMNRREAEGSLNAAGAGDTGSGQSRALRSVGRNANAAQDNVERELKTEYANARAASTQNWAQAASQWQHPASPNHLSTLVNIGSGMYQSFSSAGLFK